MSSSLLYLSNQRSLGECQESCNNTSHDIKTRVWCYYRATFAAMRGKKKDFIPVSNPPQHADRSPMQQEVYPSDVVGIEVHVRCIPTEPQDVPPSLAPSFAGIEFA